MNETPQLQSQRQSIVLLGDFNPKIFQPLWFGMEGLIGKQEAKDAEINIIHPKIVSFSLAWLRIQILPEQFSVETQQESYFEALRDLVVGTFKLLSHTPLRMMGINRDMDFAVNSKEFYHQVGHKLAPKEIYHGILHSPGLRSLSIEENPRQDGQKGYIRLTVQPSNGHHLGIVFSVNDHYEVKEPEKSIGASELIEILEKICSQSFERSEKMILSLLERL
ncbi:MAG: hypothetical protein HQK60_01915 [Deltaproteobacteria bacterium]|nr:hypothetical protein [Deltaproteobacteria bacterium]